MKIINIQKMRRSQLKDLFIFVVCATLFALPANAEQSLTPKQYVREVARETLSIWKRNLVEPLSHVWEPWFVPKSINLSTLKSSQENTETKHNNQEKIVGEVLAFSGSVATNELTKEEVLTWLKDLFLLQQTTKYSQQAETQAATPVITRYYSSGVTQGLADSLSRSVREIDSSIGGDLDALEANGVFNTSVLSVDTVNTRVGVGTSTPSDTLSVNGPVYLAQVSAPSNTSNRMYNLSGDLYWNGNLIGGGSVGNWSLSGPDVYRASGNVGVGTTTASARLAVESVAGRAQFVIGSSTATQFIVDKNGNVGVGTTSPSQLLTVGNNNQFTVNSSGHVATSKIGISTDTSRIEFLNNQIAFTAASNFLRFNSNGFGINVLPLNSLDVSGNAVIGSGYAGINSAPSNGLLVQGNVGIGTTNPGTKLQVGDGTGQQTIKILSGHSVTGDNAPLLSLFSSGNREGVIALTSDYLVLANTNGLANYTNSTIQSAANLTIRNGGNVGIGTTNPGAKLEVAVTSSNDNNFISLINNQSWTNGKYNNIIWKDNSGSATGAIGLTYDGVSTVDFAVNSLYNSGYKTTSDVPFIVKGSGRVGVGTTTPFAKLSVQSTAGAAQFVIGSSTATQFIVDRNGNVGVGTVTPVSPLEVRATSADNAATFSYPSGSAAVYITGNAASTQRLIFGGGGGGRVQYDNSSNFLDFWTNNSSKVVINASGNVGIGTTTPGAGLVVNTVGTINGLNTALQIGTGAILSPNNNGLYTFNAAGNDVVPLIKSDTSNNVWINAGGPGAIRFGAGGANEYMRLDTNGNVGIGTTTPWRTLSVNGTAAFRGLVNDSTGYYVCLNTTTGQLATSTSACGASSERFKENIQDIGYGLEEVLSLRPVSFDYKANYIPNAPKQLGFIAEEVDLLVPELVARDDSGQIQGLDYPKFTALLVRAVQEMNERLDSLVSQMQAALAWFTQDGKLKVQNDICVDDVCVTKEQFKQILLDAAVGATQTTTPTESVGADNSPQVVDSGSQIIDDSGEEQSEEVVPEENTGREEGASSIPEVQNNTESNIDTENSGETPVEETLE